MRSPSNALRLRAWKAWLDARLKHTRYLPRLTRPRRDARCRLRYDVLFISTVRQRQTTLWDGAPQHRRTAARSNQRRGSRDAGRRAVNLAGAPHNDSTLQRPATYVLHANVALFCGVDERSAR